MKYTYLIVVLAAFIIPFIFSFHPKIKFYKQYKNFWPANLIVAIIFILWDLLFTDLNVWGFNPDYCIGIRFINLPIEEILFFIFIPYACLFTYHCFKISFKEKSEFLIEKFVSTLLILILAIAGFLNIGRLYTSSTLIALSTVILILQFVLKVKWMRKFYFTYLILTIPFLIVNGILTGTGLEKPIVWYDNNENLGIRIFTIPVEDVFYGMLLIIMNVGLMEWFASGLNNKTTII